MLGNHDFSRPGSKYAKGEDDARLKAAAAMQLTLRGTPFIYYGEEIGMRNLSITSKSQVLDPIGRQFWPFFKGRDGYRSPMQWDDTINAGFSQGRPWLPVHPNFAHRNLAAQKENPDSLYHFYRALLRLRRQRVALRQGDFIPLDQRPEHILAYRRVIEGEHILVMINFSDYERTYPLDKIDLSRAKLLLSSRRDSKPEGLESQLLLAPNEVLIMEEMI